MALRTEKPPNAANDRVEAPLASPGQGAGAGPGPGALLALLGTGRPAPGSCLPGRGPRVKQDRQGFAWFLFQHCRTLKGTS